MSLEKKYNIPADIVKKLVNDGVISCSVIRHFEIFDAYTNFVASGKAQGKSNPDVYYELGQQLGVSDSTVKQIVYKLGKIS